MSTELITTDPRRGCTSASNAAADRRCEGRHIAQRGIPQRESADADFGRKIHEALANNSPDGLDGDQLGIYEQCTSIRDMVVEKVFGGDAPNIKVIKERRLWAKITAKPGDKNPAAPRYEHSGQADYMARMGSRLLIIEYKALPGDVPSSSHNEQLRDQAVLAFRALLPKEIITAVVQPLVTHDPELCLYDSSTLAKAELEMYARVRASNNPSAQRTPNSISCKFCLANTTCAEYQQWAGSQLPDTTPIIGVPVAQWTPQQRTYFCDMKSVAQKWLDDCEAEMKRLLKENPESVPGYHLKDGKTRETVTDPNQLFARFVELGSEWAHKEFPGIPPAQSLNPIYMGCVAIRKGELEVLVRRVAGLKGKGLLAKMNELLDGITETKQDAPSLSKVRGG